MVNGTILQYEVLEKLGEGGMGVVYKAHDTKLDRIVALKFLPQHLTGDSNEKERFYHEARAAAALTHQNIAIIYEIGEHEDQVFIAMEYVEGKTLKQLVEMESDSLSIKKTLDIAVQVCDGLAAAHEKGIVHRDIKSDNIMLTPKGQVKIMDFGLAKLKGASKLTKEGSTLGTAAYMSPEQARGEDVDRRSDIFSFGVVLYELLTAHLPFRGEHQAALLYSVVNEDPQPIARFNEKISPKLEEIVSKAIEKDKEERYQHADDLTADLRRERKNLEYARAGNIKSDTSRPVVREADKEGRLEKSTSAEKKYPLKIIIPAVAAILIAGSFLIFNPFRSRETQNTGVTSTGNSLAVMYFQNIPDPTDKKHTGEMLTNLLITSLSQVKGLDVISRDRLLEIEKEMEQTSAKELSPSLSIKIAKQAGVTTMLTGSILQMKPRLAVTTNLVNVRTGEVIGSQQLTNFTGSQIFSLVDSLSYLIRDDLQGGTPSLSVTKSVAEVTTDSPEAYRAYTEGLNLRDKLFWKEANSAFERAVDLDPNFAMAYFYLAGTQSTLGETEAAQRSWQKAVELSGETTEKERLQIRATYYTHQHNIQKSIETNYRIIRLYPREIQPYIELGVIYDDVLFDCQKGVAVLREGANANPDAKLLWNQLAYSYANLGDRQEALEAANQYVNLAPAEPNPYDSKGDIYAWFMDYDSSRDAYDYSTSLRNDYDAYKLGYYDLLNQRYDEAKKYFQMSGYSVGLGRVGGVKSRIPLPLVEVERGEIKDAENRLIHILKFRLSSVEREYVLYELVHLCYEASQYPDMLEYAKELSSELHKDPTNRIYGREYVAWALVKNGRLHDAGNLIDEIRKDIDSPFTVNRAELDYSVALISFEEGKYDTALREFTEFEQMLPPNHEPNIFYAICLLKNAETKDAIKELQRVTHWPNSNDLYLMCYLPGERTYWPIQSVIAHYWLGAAYEEQGEKGEAISEYKKFLDIWKDADFSSPEIKDGKARVSELEGSAR